MSGNVNVCIYFELICIINKCVQKLSVIIHIESNTEKQKQEVKTWLKEEPGRKTGIQWVNSRAIKEKEIYREREEGRKKY